MTYYYLEKDGQVFLIKKNGRFSFPQTKEEIPFEFDVIRKMPLKEDILYCYPKVDGYPDQWTYKDDIPKMNADPVVQLAVNRSLVRHISDAIIAKDGKVLMVKASRGFLKGVWDLPGGFISYGEDPEESLIREVKEETGLDIKVGDLIRLKTDIAGELYYIAFYYICNVIGGGLKPDPNEISEAEWLPFETAIKECHPLIRPSLEAYKKTLG